MLCSGLQCLDYFVASPSGTPKEGKVDLIMFNWGLHDGPQLFDFPPANVTIPGQEGNSSVYPEQLESIVVRLKALAPDSQLLFAITSPMICKADQDTALQYMNSQAAAIMAKHGIETVDLHAAIVGPPLKQNVLERKSASVHIVSMQATNGWPTAPLHQQFQSYSDGRIFF